MPSRQNHAVTHLKWPVCREVGRTRGADLWGITEDDEEVDREEESRRDEDTKAASYLAEHLICHDFLDFCRSAFGSHNRTELI